jgi:zinc protease
LTRSKPWRSPGSISEISNHCPWKSNCRAGRKPARVRTGRPAWTGDATFVEVAWRAPKGNSEDFFAFTILESLLTGPSSLNMFGGGGISNRTSRLYLALVEKELAVGVNGSLNASIDPGTFTINLTKHPARSVSTLLSALDNEIEKIQSSRLPRQK